jgi:hypothetical protein
MLIQMNKDIPDASFSDVYFLMELLSDFNGVVTGYDHRTKRNYTIDYNRVIDFKLSCICID